MATIKEIVSRHPGFNHITVRNDDGEEVVIHVEDDNVYSLYDSNNPFLIKDRAGFSLEPDLSRAAGNGSILALKLLDHTKDKREWLGAYMVHLASKASGWENATTDATNIPTRDEELEIQLDPPVAVDELDDAVADERDAITVARGKMGLSDDELKMSVLNKEKEFKPLTDEQNFVNLACGIPTPTPIWTLLTNFNSGFYISELLNAIIDLDEDASVSVVGLVKNDDGSVTKGERIEFHPIEVDNGPDGTESGSNDDDDDYEYENESLNTYLDQEPADGVYKDFSMYAEPDSPDNYRNSSDDITLPPVEPVPSTPEPVDDYGMDGTLPTESDDTAKPVTAPADDSNESVVSVQEEDETVEEEPADDDTPTEDSTEPVVDEPSLTVQEETVEETSTDEEPVDGTDDSGVDELVGFIGKAKAKLAELKEAKSKVDDEIDDLNSIDIEETDYLIESYENDRRKLDDQIADLRKKRGEVVENIAEARKTKAEQEESLAHLDERKSESDKLAKQIESLEQALK